MKYSGVLILLLVFAFNTGVNTPCVALNQEEATSREFLLKHGYSLEASRIVELQKARLQAKQTEIKTNNKIIKFFKNIFYEKDLTLPLTDFGHNKIYTPEAPPGR